MGRPTKKIDPVQVEKLGRIDCTDEEIADILGCSRRTLKRRFAPVLARARAMGKMSLRRAQYIRAVKDRSDRMLIHLGQVRLGQSAGLRGDLDEVLDRVLGAGREDHGGAGELPQ